MCVGVLCYIHRGPIYTSTRRLTPYTLAMWYTLTLVKGSDPMCSEVLVHSWHGIMDEGSK